MSSKVSILILMLSLVGANAFAGKIVSQYTSLKNCPGVQEEGEGEPTYTSTCAGLGGYTIEVIEGDLRVNVALKTDIGVISDLKMYHTVPASNAPSYVGDNAEWRGQISQKTKKLVPSALIFRLFSNTNPDSNVYSTHVQHTDSCNRKTWR
jgi:hypothetical protein